MSRRILYIEDDRIDVQLLFKALSGHGLIIDFCDDFDEADRLYGLNDYDLVISDMTVGPDNLSEVIDSWKDRKLVILSNHPPSTHLQGVAIFEKPFQKEMISKFLPLKERPDQTKIQLEQLCGGRTKEIIEILDLISEELDRSRDVIDGSIEDDDSLENIIHKAISKFGLLNMTEAKRKLEKTETDLRGGSDFSKEDRYAIASLFDMASAKAKKLRQHYEMRDN